MTGRSPSSTRYDRRVFRSVLTSRSPSSTSGAVRVGAPQDVQEGGIDRHGSSFRERVAAAELVNIRPLSHREPQPETALEMTFFAETTEARKKQLREFAEQGKTQLFETLWNELLEQIARGPSTPSWAGSPGSRSIGNFEKAGQMLSALVARLQEQGLCVPVPRRAPQDDGDRAAGAHPQARPPHGVQEHLQGRPAPPDLPRAEQARDRRRPEERRSRRSTRSSRSRPAATSTTAPAGAPGRSSRSIPRRRRS